MRREPDNGDNCRWWPLRWPPPPCPWWVMLSHWSFQIPRSHLETDLHVTDVYRSLDPGPRTWTLRSQSSWLLLDICIFLWSVTTLAKIHWESILDIDLPLSIIVINYNNFLTTHFIWPDQTKTSHAKRVQKGTTTMTDGFNDWTPWGMNWYIYDEFVSDL